MATTNGRTTTQGYSGGSIDKVRQQFTQKERDNETGLDYFGARYYASTHGRFTGADPYDINLERQEIADHEEADNLFTEYIGQPQHWNHYPYALNNPLRYVDPDGRKDEEYEVELLGKKIKVKISDKLDNDTRAAIKENINAAIARINEGKDNLTKDQIKQINRMSGITVSPDFRASGMNKAAAVFQMTPQSVTASSSIDFLAGAILHDDRHLGQSDPEPDTEKFINNEKEASAFAADVARRIHLDNEG